MATAIPSIIFHMSPESNSSEDSNGTLNSNDTLPEYDSTYDSVMDALRIFIPILFGTVAIVGTCGNLLVIIVVLSNKQMRNTTNMLIISLALADLFFIIICVPFTAVLLTAPNWPFGDVFCKMYQYSINVTCYASVYTLVLMSLDRYLAVVHPIWSMNIRTTANALYLIIVSWVVIIALTIPILFEHGTVEFGGHVYCLNLKVLKEYETKGYTPHGRLFFGMFFFFSYLMPLTLVCFLYGFLLHKLFFRMPQGRNQSAESIRGKKRVTKMVVVVVAVFAVCWLPINIRFLIQYFGEYPDSAAFNIFHVLATCLAYMNSCMNPILYAFLSDNFRKSFRKLLCCQSKFQSMQCQMEFERTNIATYKVARAEDDDQTKQVHVNGESNGSA